MMGRLDWDHNGYYHRLLLRQLPRGCDQVLEVGCGAGAFAVKLAGPGRSTRSTGRR
jgi:ubiquinone/menaquinone biosynthesis C-methylase UbiE